MKTSIAVVDVCAFLVWLPDLLRAAVASNVYYLLCLSRPEVQLLIFFSICPCTSILRYTLLAT